MLLFVVLISMALWIIGYQLCNKLSPKEMFEWIASSAGAGMVGMGVWIVGLISIRTYEYLFHCDFDTFWPGDGTGSEIENMDFVVSLWWGTFFAASSIYAITTALSRKSN